MGLLDDEDITPLVVVSVPFLGGLLGLGMVSALLARVRAATAGTGDQVVFADQISAGVRAFLIVENTYLTPVVAVCAAFIVAALQGHEGAGGWQTMLCFVCGALLSASAGWAGMTIATEASVKTTEAAKHGLSRALEIAFAGGAVAGFYVVSIGILGLSILLYIFAVPQGSADTHDMFDAIRYLRGLALGASIVALFARVAGGIYSTALAGKVASNLQEDDPRNAAALANNVGGCVSNISGAGADLFESFVCAIVACASLASSAREVCLPFWIAGFGVVATGGGVFTVSTKDDASQSDLERAIRRGIYAAAALAAALAVIWVQVLFDGNRIGWRYFACHVIGIVAGVLLGDATEYYTAAARSVRPGQVLGLGMLSGFPPAVIISVVVLACHGAGGAYGIAVSAVGMLSTLGVVLGAHAFAPIADNAASIAEMTPRCTEEVRRCTDTLDAAGNASAAAGEGLGLGAAVLTAISLLNAFVADVPVACTVSAIVIPRCLADSMHLTDSTVIAGLIIGAILPFVFAALSTLSVGKVAGAAGVEVERQLRAIPGLLEGRDEAACDSTACVTACTKSSLNQTVLPGLIAVLTPISVGLLVGARCLGGLLAGTVASGLVLAASMRTSHARDVSPPAINVLMKLAAAVSLVLARVFRDDWVDWWRGGLVLALEIALCGATWYYVWVLAEDLESPEEDTETPAANRKLAQGKRTMRGGIPNPDAGNPDEGLRDGSLVKRSTRV